MGVPTRDGRVWSAPRNALRIAVIAAAVALSAASGPGGDPIPEPDTCNSGQVGSVGAIEIGDPDESSFVPLGNGDAVNFAVGGQGTDMLPIRIRISGSDLPECLAQSTRVVYDGNTIATESSPLQTYEDEAGTRATRAVYVIMADIPPTSGDSFDVSTTVGTVTTTLTLMRAPAISP